MDLVQDPSVLAGQPPLLACGAGDEGPLVALEVSAQLLHDGETLIDLSAGQVGVVTHLAVEQREARGKAGREARVRAVEVLPERLR
jgi:hypothetical protein